MHELRAALDEHRRLLGRIAADQGHWWLAAASRVREGLLRVEISLRR